MSTEPVFVEVRESVAPLSTRRLVAGYMRLAIRRAGLEQGSRTVRWFSRLDTDKAGVQIFRAVPSGALTFVASKRLVGAVFPDTPRDVWLNIALDPRCVAETVRHEVEHSRLVELTGPPRSAEEWAAHEFAASHRHDGGRRRSRRPAGDTESDLQGLTATADSTSGTHTYKEGHA